MPLQPGKGNQPGKRPILSIEDPLNPMMDLGRGSFRALGLKSAFEFGFMTLTQAVHPLKENLKDPNVHR